MRETAPSQVLRRHRVIGLISGIVVGAGVGYLASIPRVRRAERLDDAPFEQIDYVVDPIVGAALGAGAGLILGSWPTHRWEPRYVAPERGG